MKYLVTTRLEKIPSTQIAMVDGTVPGWTANFGDLHYDHHQENGGAIQIDEMMEAPKIGDNVTIITTQVDADACVAAAWLQLNDKERQYNLRKLRAIAFDCDHLIVPEDLTDLADFAAQAVAAMKANSTNVVADLGFSSDRKSWTADEKEQYASLAFKRGTESLIRACSKDSKFPGESGEARKYWEEVETNTQKIIHEGRVSLYRECLLFDGKGLQGKYIDPRCWLKAAKVMGFNPKNPITLTQREVIVENAFKGLSYTIGTVPLHPNQSEFDYTKKIFAALTAAERQRNPAADGWGGRATVGGSGWNTPSLLGFTEVIDIALKA